jgi:hypothetical protein
LISAAWSSTFREKPHFFQSMASSSLWAFLRISSTTLPIRADWMFDATPPSVTGHGSAERAGAATSTPAARATATTARFHAFRIRPTAFRFAAWVVSRPGRTHAPRTDGSAVMTSSSGPRRVARSSASGLAGRVPSGQVRAPRSHGAL